MQTEYRTPNYFNETDLFYFETPSGMTLYSKCHFDKGYWWTNKTPYYKCDSVKAVIIPIDTLMISKFDGIGKLKRSLDIGINKNLQLGIFWIKDANHSNYANHYYWNDSKTINIYENN